MSDALKNFDDLLSLFGTLLKIDTGKLRPEIFDLSIPLSLRQLYSVRSEYDKIKPRNELFHKQDHLVPYSELNPGESLFNFIVENSGNWSLQTERNNDSPKVYIDREELIPGSLEDVLITYALMELTFNLPFEGSNQPLEKITPSFSTVTPLWTNKNNYAWADSYSYYLLDDDTLFMEADGLCFSGTIDETQLKKLL